MEQPKKVEVQSKNSRMSVARFLRQVFPEHIREDGSLNIAACAAQCRTNKTRLWKSVNSNVLTGDLAKHIMWGAARPVDAHLVLSLVLDEPLIVVKNRTKTAD